LLILCEAASSTTALFALSLIPSINLGFFYFGAGVSVGTASSKTGYYDSAVFGFDFSLFFLEALPMFDLQQCTLSNKLIPIAIQLGFHF